MQMLHSLLLLLLLLTTEEGWGKPCMKIGILGEFKTATGKTTSPFGIDIRNGVSLGIQRLKRSGEAVCFEPVEIDINNSISNIPDLIRRAVTQDNVRLFLGLGTSDQALMAADALRDTKSILITPTASSEALVGPAKREIMMFPRNSRIAETMARESWRQGHRAVAIISAANSKYSSDMAENFALALKRQGGRIVEYISTHNADLDAADVERIRVAKPDAIFMPLFELDVVRVLSLLDSSRYMPIIIGTDSWGNTSEIIREMARNISFRAILPRIYSTDLKTTENLSLMQLAKDAKRYKIGDLSAFSYEGVLLYNKMLKTCGGIEKVVGAPQDCLRKSLPFQATTGTIASTSFLSLNRPIQIRTLVGRQ